MYRIGPFGQTILGSFVMEFCGNLTYSRLKSEGVFDNSEKGHIYLKIMKHSANAVLFITDAR